MLLAAILTAVWLNARRPSAPASPLAIDPAEVVTATYEGAALEHDSPAYAVAARLPKRLSATQRAGAAVAWAEPVTLRLTLRDGATLWLQIMREGVDDLVRINADAPGDATPPVKSRAAAIRALRLNAYRLPAESLSPILGEVTGEVGKSSDAVKANKFIHRNKAGKVI